jgi:hypothetical protein
MGTVFGAATMTSSLAMAIGPLWRVGGYSTPSTAMLGSIGGRLPLAFGAMAIALVFPPLPRHQLQPA